MRYEDSEQYRAWIKFGIPVGPDWTFRYGNEGGNTLTGTDEIESIFGYGGNDRLFGLGNTDLLHGGDGDDSLYGGSGNDELTGGNGSDALYGGSGNDHIVGNDFRQGDTTAYGGYDRLQGGRGSDLLLAGYPGQGLGTSRAWADYTETNLTVFADLRVADVTADLASVTVIGGAFEFDRLGNIPDLSSGGGNDLLYGSYVANVFRAGGGNDQLRGEAGDDTLYGESGNDKLWGGADSDRLDGGAGDDELRGEGGVDRLTGGDGTNRMWGGDGGDFVYGGSGVDYLYGEAGDDSLYGGDSRDFLYGGNGRDLLDGGAGGDVMEGGAGDDTYVVDSALDAVADTSGVDRVVSSVRYALGNDIENLTLSGTGFVIGTGNNGANTIQGNVGVNYLYGRGGNDVLFGMGGDDRLYGDAGADRMYGGAGNDTYYVDNVGDVAADNYVSNGRFVLGSGIDRVESTVGHALNASIENLTLTGTANVNGSGNGKGNVVVGNAGANVLNGLGGHDVLTGGAGRDTFDFNTAPGSGNVDRITDFSHADDTIRLENAIFTALPAGALAAGAFKDITAISATLDGDDRILYDRNTGSLLYDADGSGAGGRVLFAVLANRPADLTFQDFVVV